MLLHLHKATWTKLVRSHYKHLWTKLLRIFFNHGISTIRSFRGENWEMLVFILTALRHWVHTRPWSGAVQCYCGVPLFQSHCWLHTSLMAYNYQDAFCHFFQSFNVVTEAASVGFWHCTPTMVHSTECAVTVLRSLKFAHWVTLNTFQWWPGIGFTLGLLPLLILRNLGQILSSSVVPVSPCWFHDILITVASIAFVFCRMKRLQFCVDVPALLFQCA